MTSNRRWCASAISLLSCGQESLAPLIPSSTYLPAAGGRHTNLMAVFLLTAENNVQTASSTSPILPGSMLTSLRETRPEFAIHDVFNLGVDENDNTAMRKIMEKLNIIQRDAGCAIGVIHRFTKASEGNLTQRIRALALLRGGQNGPSESKKFPWTEVLAVRSTRSDFL
jgi:hypothetical protein